VFDFGIGNVTVDLTYGLNGPSEMMKKAAMTRLRSRLMSPRSGLPERTRSHTDPAGNTFVFTGPDAYRTGIDSVDAVYARYSLRSRRRVESGAGSATTPRPAFGQVSYDPQWGGLFRGGPR
jgi:hypothetical protein